MYPVINHTNYWKYLGTSLVKICGNSLRYWMISYSLILVFTFHGIIRNNCYYFQDNTMTVLHLNRRKHPFVHLWISASRHDPNLPVSPNICRKTSFLSESCVSSWEGWSRLSVSDLCWRVLFCRWSCLPVYRHTHRKQMVYSAVKCRFQTDRFFFFLGWGFFFSTRESSFELFIMSAGIKRDSAHFP